MKRYLADCAACGWEGQAFETQPEAAAAGLEHLTVTHPSAVTAGTHNSVRLWEFELAEVTVTGELVLAEVEPKPKPEPEEPEPEETEPEETEPEEPGQHHTKPKPRPARTAYSRR